MQSLTQEIFQVRKTSFIDPVQDSIRFCRIILDSYIGIYIKKGFINIKLKNLQYFKR